MVWSPEQWRQEVEYLVERSAQKVLAELEEEVMSRLKAMSKDIMERICLPESVKAVELDFEDGIRLLDLHNLPVKQELPKEPVEEATKEPVEEATKEPVEEATKEPVEEATKEAVEEATKEQGEYHSLWYAFGIVKEEQIVWPLVIGIENSPCQIIWQDSSFNTEESQPMLVSEGSLGILVCAVPESEYDEIALHEHLQDLAWVEIRARRHEEVLLEIMEITTIIPLPFGTIFRGKDQIKSQLISHWKNWQLEMARLIGHYEMQLKLLVDPRKLQQFLEEKLPYSGEQSGGYFLRRQWEKKLEVEQEALIDTYSESLFQDLKSLTVEAMLLGKEETLPSGLKQIFTAQFLLTKQNKPAWEELIHTFDQKTDCLGFVLEIAGPWPTYHFAGLDKLDELNEEERNSGGNKQNETSHPLASCGETLG
ncbi:MAG: GvpL/GvpF family gas vesicle protein [Desulfitobacteriaceae bacterium]